jgi:multidrug efflux pump subunit AcrB
MRSVITVLVVSTALMLGVLTLGLRHVMGVGVFSGILAVIFFGLALTPVFYVVLQDLVERQSGAARQLTVQPAHHEESRHV